MFCLRVLKVISSFEMEGKKKFHVMKLLVDAPRTIDNCVYPSTRVITVLGSEELSILNDNPRIVWIRASRNPKNEKDVYWISSVG